MAANNRRHRLIGPDIFGLARCEIAEFDVIALIRATIWQAPSRPVACQVHRQGGVAVADPVLDPVAKGCAAATMDEDDSRKRPGTIGFAAVGEHPGRLALEALALIVHFADLLFGFAPSRGRHLGQGRHVPQAARIRPRGG